MIAIIDYDAGNLKSVEKAFDYIGQESIITGDADKILAADKVILPGVGSFGDAMDKIRKCNLETVINKVVENKTPFLGICLGMQLLYDYSDEAPDVKGLGILKGKICKIPESPDIKVPHIGWNNLNLQNNGRLYKGIPDNSYVYFVHSYYLKAEDEFTVKATTEYGTLIHASVEKDNIFACQFHPEKSSETGLAILNNFANL